MLTARSSLSQQHTDYSSTPLPRKLGIVTAKGICASVALLGEPPGFRSSLGDVPSEVSFTETLTASTSLAIAFVRLASELEPLLDQLSTQLPAAAHVWIAWPKVHHQPGFNGNAVRETGLAAGFVDYKVCSLGAEWSALKFARRKGGDNGAA